MKEKKEKDLCLDCSKKIQIKFDEEKERKYRKWEAPNGETYLIWDCELCKNSSIHCNIKKYEEEE